MVRQFVYVHGVAGILLLCRKIQNAVVQFFSGSVWIELIVAEIEN